jgi:DNA-directed RNA polymerase subunit RPC12/RpoP
MSNLKVEVIGHGIKWILDGEVLKCPDCSLRMDINLGQYNVTDISINGKSIGRKVVIACPQCSCKFMCSRFFKEDE